MGLIETLTRRTGDTTPIARFTLGCGIFYLAFGLGLVGWPAQLQVVLHERAFVGDEASLIRALGMAVAIIGWFYVFAARSGARPVFAASVVDRLLVPLLLGPLALSGVFPLTLGTFAVLDPALALIAWALLRREH